MQLDSYAKYKFAQEATGGTSRWGKSDVLSLSAMVFSDNEEGHMLTVRYPNQELRAVATTWRSMTPAMQSNYLVVIKSTTGSTDAISSLANVRKATPIFKEFVVKRFEKLAAEWKAARNQISSGTEMFLHPAYQKIIGMGPEVVPLILREMEANLDHWFWALKAITEKDPVPPAHRGRLKLMAKDWLNWARKQGYQW